MGATSDAPSIGGACTNDCLSLNLEGGSGPFGSGGTGTGGPSYVTLRNIRVNGEMEVAGNQGRTVAGTTGVGLTFDHVSVGAVYLVGLTNVLVDHANIGGCYSSGTHPCHASQSNDWSLAGSGGERQATSGTIQNSVFHDYWRDSSSDHSECWFALDWRAFTIRDSQFYNCTISGGIRIERITDPPADAQLTIENNWFGTMYDQVGGSQRCEDVTWGANSGALSNVLIRYNSFVDGGGPFGSSGSPTSSFRIIGNIVGFDPNGSCEITPASANYGSAVVDHNVWTGGDKGTNSTHVASVSALYVNPAGDSTANYHLAGAAGSTLADNYVPCSSGDAHLLDDKDGNPRPPTPPCDAGSQER